MEKQRILRRGGMLIGGVLGSLVLAAFIIPPMLDWNEYKSKAEEAASMLLDKTVKIEGDLEISILPVPTVSVSGVRVMDDSAARDIATVGSLDVALSVFSLLTGDVSLKRLTLDGVKVSMIQSASGDWQVEGLSSGGTDDGAKGFQLDDVRIKNSAVTLIQNTGNAIELTALSLNIAGSVPNGPLEWNGQISVHDVPIAVTGRLKPLSNGLDKSIRFEAKLADSVLILSGKLPQRGGFEGRLTASSKNAALLKQAVNSLLDQQDANQLPNQPLELDARIHLSGSKGSIETKRFMIGDTTARAEVTFLGQDWQQFTARLAIGTIDLDQWQFSQAQEQVKSNDELPLNNSMLFGDIEATIEAIKWHGETVRQIDIALAVDGEKVDISKMQALVPGGGTLSMGGAYHYSGSIPSFDGRIGLETGKLKDLLIWFGVDATSLPAERLMSLSWRSSIGFKNNRLSIKDIRAHLDDSAIKGSLSLTENYAPDIVDFTIDKINADAYMPTSATDSPGQSDVPLPNQTKLVINDLIFSDVRFTSVSVTGDKQANGDIKVNAGAKALGGALSVNGSVAGLTADASRSLTLRGENLDKTQLLGLFTEPDVLMRTVGDNNISMTFSIDGTLDNLSVDAAFTSGLDSVSAKGSLSIIENALGEIDLQGRLAVADSSKLLRHMGLEGARGAVGLDVTLDGNLKDAFDIRVAGDIAGSELITKGTWSKQADNNGFKGDVNLVLGERRSLPYSLQYIPAIAGLRLKSDINYGPSLMAMNNIDIAMAGGRITGGVELSGDELSIVKGAITVDGIVVEDAPTKPATLTQPWSRQNFQPLPTASMSGTLDINVKSLALKGQAIKNSNGKLLLDNNAVSILFNQIDLNNKPASFTAKIADREGRRHVDMSVDAAAIHIAPLLKSLTGKVVTEGDANLSFGISGDGGSPYSLISRLKGQGNFHATAGTFKFMDLSKLMSILRNPASAITTIRSMGGMLGKGNTSFSQLDGSMNIDRGIMNITSMKGAGDWGTLDMAGPVNLVNETMDLRGSIVLSKPQDVPIIDVQFVGPIAQPKQKYNTGTLLRYALTKVNILRRDEAQSAADKAGQKPVSPTEAFVGKALDLFGKLKKKKEEEKKKDNR